MSFPRSKLFEQLAGIEHKRWSDWQKYVFRVCEEGVDGTLIIPAWAVRKAHQRPEAGLMVREWQRQIDTSYENLTEEEKNGDRALVMRYWGA